MKTTKIAALIAAIITTGISFSATDTDLGAGISPRSERPSLREFTICCSTPNGDALDLKLGELTTPNTNWRYLDVDDRKHILPDCEATNNLFKVIGTSGIEACAAELGIVLELLANNPQELQPDDPTPLSLLCMSGERYRWVSGSGNVQLNTLPGKLSK